MAAKPIIPVKMNDSKLDVLLWLKTASRTERKGRGKKKCNWAFFFAPLCVFAWAYSSGSCSLLIAPAEARKVPPPATSIHESFIWCTVSFHRSLVRQKRNAHLVWSHPTKDWRHTSTHSNAALMKCLKNWRDSFFYKYLYMSITTSTLQSGFQIQFWVGLLITEPFPT